MKKVLQESNKLYLRYAVSDKTMIASFMASKFPTYRFSIKTENVYSFMGLPWSMTLASYKSEVSGFVRKDRLPVLEDLLIPYGYSFKNKNIKLMESGRYFKIYEEIL